MTDHQTLQAILSMVDAERERMDRIEETLKVQNTVLAAIQQDVSQAKGGLLFGKWLMGIFVILAGAIWAILTQLGFMKHVP